MATAVTTSGFINAKLRARISKLLNDEFFHDMASARSMVEAVATLNGTRYSEVAGVYSQTGDIKLCELELVRSEYRALEALKKYTPKGITRFTQGLLGLHEVMTLKNAIRLWFERTVRGRRVDDKVGYLERGEGAANLPVDSIINAADAQELVKSLEATEYAEVIRDRMQAPERDGSLFAVEVALDRWYYLQLLARARELSRTDSAIALRLIGIQVDIQNVNWLVRMKHFYELEESQLLSSVIPGGALISQADLSVAYKSEHPLEALTAALGPRYTGLAENASSGDESRQLGRLALLENLLRSVLSAEIRRTLGGYPFTIGTVLAYFLLIRNEVNTLITVLNAKAYDLSIDRIEGLI